MSRDLSIYVHIPFCVRKCLYCDFLSAPASLAIQEQYLHRLCQEIGDKAAAFPEYRVSTVFFGGGTPTAVDAEGLCQVLETIFHYFNVDPDAEISLECNPGTASLQALRLYREAGFNRLSIGLQSADDGLLKTLGRIHTYEQFLQTFAWAREAGFENINVDLMSALPGQTLAQYEDTLTRVLALKPEHISAYSLIVEEGTPFYEMELNLPDEDLDRLMYQRTGEILHEYGYERYEISNYALPGKECRHNLVYWERGAYLGLGLGAASLYDHTRYRNQSDLSKYLTWGMGEADRKEENGLTLAESTGSLSRDEHITDVQKEQSVMDIGQRHQRSSGGEERNETKNEKCTECRKEPYKEIYEERQPLTPREEMEEFYFLGLRCMRGVSQSAFRAQFGGDAEGQFKEAIESSIADGLMERSADGDRLYLTPRGIDVSNMVFVRFLE
ncbi:MAG: radical SAM family heme chaperone HemW [Lachnospiraceae bacterium]|nr:radical SAM family heme chaperone HemW [Lachnospiraceae bacterium]